MHLRILFRLLFYNFILILFLTNPAASKRPPDLFVNDDKNRKTHEIFSWVLFIVNETVARYFLDELFSIILADYFLSNP